MQFLLQTKTHQNCTETHADSELFAQLNHLVRSHVGNVLVLLIEVLGELCVLDLGVVYRRQRINYLHRHQYHQTFTADREEWTQLVQSSQSIKYMTITP